MRVKIILVMLAVIGVTSVIGLVNNRGRARIEIPGVGRAKINVSDSANGIRIAEFLLKDDTLIKITELHNGMITLRVILKKWEGTNFTEAVKIQETLRLKGVATVNFYKERFTLFPKRKVKIIALDRSLSHTGLVEMMFVPE